MLHKRALNRNPDEFYFHMVRSRMQDGEHVDTPKEEECTPEQLKLMQSQDLKYISHKRLVESRKIDKLQAQLHLVDAEKPNNHVFFVDTKEEGKHLLNTCVSFISNIFFHSQETRRRRKTSDSPVTFIEKIQQTKARRLEENGSRQNDE